MVVSQIRSLYRDANDLLRTVIKRVYEEWDTALEQWRLKKFDNLVFMNNLCDPIKAKDGSIDSYSDFKFGDIQSDHLWLIEWIWPDRSQITAKLRINAQGDTVFEHIKTDYCDE